MSPNGAVTRGFLFNGRRWAAAKGAGLMTLPQLLGFGRMSPNLRLESFLRQTH